MNPYYLRNVRFATMNRHMLLPWPTLTQTNFLQRKHEMSLKGELRTSGSSPHDADSTDFKAPRNLRASHLIETHMLFTLSPTFTLSTMSKTFKPDPRPLWANVSCPAERPLQRCSSHVDTLTSKKQQDVACEGIVLYTHSLDGC